MQKWLLLFFCLGSIAAKAQAPVIDGIFHASEWQQATQIFIHQSLTDTTTVYLIHDGGNFYFAFAGNLESNNLFPEILIDVNNDQATTWQPDDWWFHVSATDCESQGAYAAFGNCQAVQPDWIGVPNMTPGPPATDTVEIKIPFSKINLQPSQGDTIGIAFVLTNTSSQWIMYPVNANRNNPSTWVPLVFQGSIGLGAPKAEPFKVDIGNDLIDITTRHSTAIIINVFDLNGRLLHSQATEGDAQVSIADYPSGIYLLQVMGEGQSLVRKFVR